jgi:uncharacterized protein YecE (DUF72 family)
MDFGRLPNVDDVDFTLPPDDPSTESWLQSIRDADSAGGFRFYCGAPVWNHAGLAAKLYPRGARSSDFLKHYARQFNAVELNATYYGLNHASLERWRAAVGPGFTFCPKMLKAVTHERALYDAATLTAEFCAGVRTLGASLGPVFALLPPAFGPERLPVLERWIELWPDDLELTVELRHPAWFSDAKARARLFELLRARKVIAALTDSAGRRDVLHQTLSGRAAFIRFLGNRLHKSDFARLDAWIDRVALWKSHGLSRAFLFLHQPDEGLVPELAAHLETRVRLQLDPQWNAPRLMPRDEQPVLF